MTTSIIKDKNGFPDIGFYKLSERIGLSLDNLFELLNIKEYKIEDNNDKETYYEDSDGDWTKREFNVNDNIIYIEYSNGEWTKWEYDANDNCIKINNSDGYCVKWEYDSNSKLIAEIDSNGGYIEFTK